MDWLFGGWRRAWAMTASRSSRRLERRTRSGFPLCGPELNGGMGTEGHSDIRRAMA